MGITTWILIAVCLMHSAMFSGLNLAFFSVSKLRLELEVSKNNKDASKVLELRRNPNFLLVTILWGNVAANVLLAILSDSVLSGVMAFFFSTAIITVIGEIVPQAYFSRNALKVASLLSPILRLYQVVLFPLAWPTAFVLDKWLGEEAVNYYREMDLRQLIKLHVDSIETDIGKTEGRGVLNFLAIDDMPIKAEGEIIDPASIIMLEFQGDKPVFPPIKQSISDKFLNLVNSSQKKWIILVNPENEPKIALESDGFIRDALLNGDNFKPYAYCHLPVIITNGNTSLGNAIPRLNVNPVLHDNNISIDEDIILLWGEEKRVITGTDILDRLLRGIVKRS